MRVDFDYQIFALQRQGGISRYFCELASALQDRPGCQARIVAPLHDNQHLDRVPPGLRLGRSFRRLGRHRRLVGAINRAVTRLVALARPPDVVHETYYARTRLAPAGARVVVTIHDMIHERFPEQFDARDRVAGHKAAAVARADHVICVSENTRRDLVELLGVPEGRTSVVHHGHALRDQGAPVATGLDGPYLLHVGHRAGYKNFSALLEAYGSSRRLSSTFRLVCFGGGPLRPEEQDQARRLGLEARQLVQLDGDDRLLSALYRGAAAFVYPSRYEGFGIPPLEAMARACPVVCGRHSSLPEVVGDGAALCDTSSVESLRSTLELVCEDGGFRERLVALGLARAASFSWERAARETAAVYQRLLGRGGPG
jgi:glycosyltransferase involved in cell wall biosynthesis